MRPSWGRRFSAMSMRDRVLRRDTSAECTRREKVCTVCSTPSIRSRTMRPLALGLDVDVARPLVQGVAQQVVDGADDVAVARVHLALGAHAEELLEVLQVGQLVEVALCGGDAALEAVDLADDACRISARAASCTATGRPRRWRTVSRAATSKGSAAATGMVAAAGSRTRMACFWAKARGRARTMASASRRTGSIWARGTCMCCARASSTSSVSSGSLRPGGAIWNEARSWTGSAGEAVPRRAREASWIPRRSRTNRPSRAPSSPLARHASTTSSRQRLRPFVAISRRRLTRVSTALKNLSPCPRPMASGKKSAPWPGRSASRRSCVCRRRPINGGLIGETARVSRRHPAAEPAPRLPPAGGARGSPPLPTLIGSNPEALESDPAVWALS